MKRYLYILLIFIATFTVANAQGFDWQYSSRLPFNYPYFFVGLSGDMGYLMHNTNIDLSEDNGDCCKFGSGIGISSNIGLQSEYWMSGNWAVNAQLSYLIYGGQFNAAGYNLPFTVFNQQGKIIGHDTASFKNTMETSLHYITLKFGTKRRLFSTHLFVGTAIEFGYLLTQKSTQTESIVSPSYYKYNDGSKFRELGSHKISGISKFLFSPQLMLGYDIPFGLGMYATPYLSVNFPLQNISIDGHWNTWNFSLGISVSRAVAYK